MKELIDIMERAARIEAMRSQCAESDSDCVIEAASRVNVVEEKPLKLEVRRQGNTQYSTTDEGTLIRRNLPPIEEVLP